MTRPTISVLGWKEDNHAVTLDDLDQEGGALIDIVAAEGIDPMAQAQRLAIASIHQTNEDKTISYPVPNGRGGWGTHFYATHWGTKDDDNKGQEANPKPSPREWIQARHDDGIDVLVQLRDGLVDTADWLAA